MNFFTSYISPKAKQYVAEVLDSGMLSEGEWVRRFEKAIEEFYDNKTRVVATNSGTSALHLALKTLGIGDGDEVIIPPLTFVATGLAVLYCGAKPVFADINSKGAINPLLIKNHITPRTKAIVAVNWAGKECDHELEEIASQYGLKLIVDAAQSFGSRLYGDAVCFSFQAIKHVTTGDGGAVAFRYPFQYERGRRLSWFGIDKEKDLPGFLGEREYDLQEVGFKYHMNNIAAAIGLANMEDAEERLNMAEFWSSRYSLRLERRFYLGNAYTWAYPISVDDVERFSMYCKNVGIPTTNLHRGIDNNQIFGKQHLPMMRWWERHVVHLPIHHELKEQDIAWICEKVNEYEFES
jgi:perosamine synthetase